MFSSLSLNFFAVSTPQLDFAGGRQAADELVLLPLELRPTGVYCANDMTAIGLIFGQLTADHYEDKVAADSRIDELRAKMKVVEDKSFSRDYLDPQKRSIANAVQVFFLDGSSTEKVTVEYPIGHRRRRAEGIPELKKKFESALRGNYAPSRVADILSAFADSGALAARPVRDLMALLVK